MNISPDDFEKFGIDSTILDDKRNRQLIKSDTLYAMSNSGRLLKQNVLKSTKSIL